ncbi:MAG: hypothetical protein EOP06_16655 [Proteobacteria bacterium]|nr:MAG: hypothetical protein EOP06_16655 [Pseudomonadota bacterium]
MKSAFSLNARALLLLCTLVAGRSIAQTDDAQAAYNFYDGTVGSQNSALNNGKVYVNPFRLKNDSHNFYKINDYMAGSIVYGDQPYFDVALKYDIHQDLLVLKPKNTANSIGITLINENVNSFSIDGKDFENLGQIPNRPDFLTGFYERRYVGQNIKLYVKWHKSRSERIANNVVFDDFSLKPAFVIEQGNTFKTINSKSDLIALFPAQKDRIRDLYSKDSRLEKTDRIQFMENMIRAIDNLTTAAR